MVEGRVFEWRLKTTVAVEGERRQRCGWSRGGPPAMTGSIFGTIRQTVAVFWVLLWQIRRWQWPESSMEIIEGDHRWSIVQVKNRDEQKLRRKSQFIPLYVASYFSFNLSYVLKKTNFRLVTCHIFTIKRRWASQSFTWRDTSKTIPVVPGNFLNNRVIKQARTDGLQAKNSPEGGGGGGIAILLQTQNCNTLVLANTELQY